MKYPNWKGPENEGRFDALLNIIGEPNAEALLMGEIEVRFSPAARVLFNVNGRRIPSRTLKARHCDPNTAFHLVQPKIDYALRLARIGEYLHAGPMISAAEFESRCLKLIERLSKDQDCRNILKGVHLPICIPQTAVSDYGEALETFLAGVDRSYLQQFPERSFNNYRKDDLAKKVKIVSGSRHDALVEKLAAGPVVGLYFPNPMQGFSVHAQREQIESLPPWFWLSGGFDTGTAMVGYPDILARDFNTPGLDMPALQWQVARYSLSFEARGGGLRFDSWGDLGHADDCYSGGLFVLG